MVLAQRLKDPRWSRAVKYAPALRPRENALHRLTSHDSALEKSVESEKKKEKKNPEKSMKPTPKNVTKATVPVGAVGTLGCRPCGCRDSPARGRRCPRERGISRLFASLFFSVQLGRDGVGEQHRLVESLTYIPDLEVPPTNCEITVLTDVSDARVSFFSRLLGRKKSRAKRAIRHFPGEPLIIGVP